MKPMSTLVAPWLASIPSLAAAQGAVLVVDAAGGPGSQYTSIQDAVDAASAGDKLLVRSGSYERFAVVGKGLAIVADAGAQVVVGQAAGGPTQFRDLPADEVLFVQGISLSSNLGVPGVAPPSVRLVDMQGKAWFDDCRFDQGYPSLLILNSASVALSRCSLEGGEPYLTGFGTGMSWPGEALQSSSSTVRIHDSELRGYAGIGSSGSGSSSSGSAAAVIEGGTLHASRSTFLGGDGGDGTEDPFLPGICWPATAGGPALWLKSGSPTVQLVAVQAVGGAGGTTPCGDSAQPGLPVEVDSGSAVVLPSDGAGLALDSPAREGQSVAVTAQAPAGSLALLAWSVAADDAYLASLFGVLHLGAPLTVQVLGTVPFGGTISTSLPVPELGPGVQGIVVHAQTAACAGPSCWLGSPSGVLLLDAAL